MKPDRQQIAIAKACWWTQVFPNDGRVMLPYKWHNTNTKQSALAHPDYLNDLNACHDMEEYLSHDEYQKYYDLLVIMVACLHEEHSKVVHATAAQKSEAFLRAKGLWKE